jgi:hypothetical protein
LPAGRHAYRFWLATDADAQGHWLPDPENPRRTESGYHTSHSLLVIE